MKIKEIIKNDKGIQSLKEDYIEIRDFSLYDKYNQTQCKPVGEFFLIDLLNVFRKKKIRYWSKPDENFDKWCKSQNIKIEDEKIIKT